MVKNAYLGKSTICGHPLDSSLQNKSCTLLKAFDEFIVRFEKLVERGIRSEETLRHWRTTKRKVASFLHYKYRVADIEFADVPHSFAEDMYDFLTLDVYPPDQLHIA